MLFVCQGELTEFITEHSKLGDELCELSLPKQYVGQSILLVFRFLLAVTKGHKQRTTTGKTLRKANETLVNSAEPRRTPL